MYELHIEKRVIKYISLCPLKHQSQLKAKILSLKENPTPNDSKQLKGFDPYLRVDSGEYRIIYKIQENNVFIIHVGKRNDEEVYKAFKRLL
ncbi:MAG: Cytotoxic translational repressor of toxin-antitoxin system RelE [Rickettsiaceae bacterium]|jgi:mRNA interferase RelE/StbE|nr:Cytotoxic translational repressor of toxin-antitoxin system RelE [Rickettsiaceae bacterium]